MSNTSTPLRRTLAAVAAVLAGSAAAVAVASPAAAAITSRTVVLATSPTSTAPFKDITVGCPGTLVGLGGGAAITGGDFSAHITATVPQATSHGHYARAEVHVGGATPWAVRAYTICGNGVTGREYEVDDNTIAANAITGAVSVSCPVGKQVIGMGGYVSSDEFILSGVDVNNTLTTVTMWWARALGVPNSLTGLAEVWANCIDPVAGLERIRVLSSNNSTNKILIPACPSGKLVYDVGGGVSTGAARREAKIDALIPLASSASVAIREFPAGCPTRQRSISLIDFNAVHAVPLCGGRNRNGGEAVCGEPVSTADGEHGSGNACPD
jgi:hypothetical protein